VTVAMFVIAAVFAGLLAFIVIDVDRRGRRWEHERLTMPPEMVAKAKRGPVPGPVDDPEELRRRINRLEGRG
jgi:hypothetical protein